MSNSDLMVSYVASTRAQEVLDATALEPFHRRRERQKHLADSTNRALPLRDQEQTK